MPRKALTDYDVSYRCLLTLEAVVPALSASEAKSAVKAALKKPGKLDPFPDDSGKFHDSNDAWAWECGTESDGWNVISCKDVGNGRYKVTLREYAYYTVLSVTAYDWQDACDTASDLADLPGTSACVKSLKISGGKSGKSVSYVLSGSDWEMQPED